MVRENTRSGGPGIAILVVVLGVWALAIYRVVLAAAAQSPPPVFWIIGSFAVGVFILSGLFTVQPNEAKVLQRCGRYAGTVRHPGLRWANPFLSKKGVSLRVRNFETGRSKVNDADGNPIEIGAVVVWQVVDTAEAIFEVDNYEH